MRTSLDRGALPIAVLSLTVLITAALMAGRHDLANQRSVAPPAPTEHGS